MNKIDYNICLWKHGQQVVMSPKGVIYNCNKCEPNTIPESLSTTKRPKSRARRNKVRQTSSLSK